MFRYPNFSFVTIGWKVISLYESILAAILDCEVSTNQWDSWGHVSRVDLEVCSISHAGACLSLDPLCSIIAGQSLWHPENVD